MRSLTFWIARARTRAADLRMRPAPQLNLPRASTPRTDGIRRRRHAQILADAARTVVDSHRRAS